jgi:hypothetical protein
MQVTGPQVVFVLRSGIRLAHLRLPEIFKDAAVWDSVQKAEGEFDADLIPEGTIFKLLKTFNPAEPRVPAGNGRVADGRRAVRHQPDQELIL